MAKALHFIPFSDIYISAFYNRCRWLVPPPQGTSLWNDWKDFDMTIATQIDAQLVAEFAQELKELNQIRGNVHNILQGRARLTRELEKAKKTVRTVYWQKKQAAMYLTETDQLLQEVQEKGDQDLVAKVQQKRRKKGKSMLAAYERLNEAYDKVFDLQNRLIQMEEAAL